MDFTRTDQHISKTLRTLMTQRSISQRDISEALGISEGAVSHYMHGKIPKGVHTMIALADFFGISCDQLLHGEDNSCVTETTHATTNLLTNHAIHMEQRLEQQNSLFTRCVQALHEDLRAAVREEAQNHTHLNAAIFTEKEVWEIEANARHITVLSPVMIDEFHYDTETDALSAGPYIDMIVRCLTLPSQPTYSFWVNTHAGLPSDIEKRARSLLLEQYNCDPGIRLSIRSTTIPICTQSALYEVDAASLRASNSVLYERIHTYLSPDNIFGVVLSPSVLAQVNLAMDSVHIEYTNKFIEMIRRKRK